MSALTEVEPLPAGEVEQSAVEEAVAEVLRWRERAAQAEAKRDAHVAEVAQLEESAGSDILDDDDPDAGDRLAARIGALRASVELQGRAAAEASARAVAASARALRAQADEVAPALTAAREALSAFDAKTERLCAAVAKHTGGKVHLAMPYEEAMDAYRAGSAASFEYETPPGELLQLAVEDEQMRAAMACGLAAVVEGSKSMAEVRAEVVGSTFAGDGRRVRWDHVPSLVRDGTIPVDGLAVMITPPVEAATGSMV